MGQYIIFSGLTNDEILVRSQDIPAGLWGPSPGAAIAGIQIIVEAPEPGTIALLTLGGFGALVAIRRRRA
jgi:hypothetical protein